MKYEEIIPAMAAKLGVEGLEPKDGVCSLEIDDMLITLAKVADEDGILLSATIGEPPPEAPEAFAALLLQANHQFVNSEGTMFSQDPESKTYLLERIMPLDLIDADYLTMALGEFVDSVERWRKALEDFRPVLEAAYNAGEEIGLPDNFMAV